MTWERDAEPRQWYDLTPVRSKKPLRREKWGELVGSWTRSPSLDLGVLGAHEHVEPTGERVFTLWITPTPPQDIPDNVPTVEHAVEFLTEVFGGTDGFKIVEPLPGSVHPQMWRRIVDQRQRR